jgi:predicted nucleic acid-binding protein
VTAVDTNLLVYAHRRKSREFDRPVMRSGSSPSDRRLGDSAACTGEFLSVVTAAVSSVTPHDRSRSGPGRCVEGVAEPGASWRRHRDLAGAAESAERRRRDRIRVDDARFAAACLGTGVNEFWTADKDYGRFPRLRTHNPLVRS